MLCPRVATQVTEEEPAFLRGQTRLSRELSPIKVVKNPDGSMQRAAMTQSALAKERKELREQQDRQMLDAIPRDLNRPWNDPMGADERHLAAELRGLGTTFELPEWKRETQKSNVTYGKLDRRSIKEQRESLPVFGLKDELLRAFRDNQVLVVIGETGSGKTTQMTQYLCEAGYSALVRW